MRKAKVKKVFLETSVFIRYFTQDNKEKYADCLQLFELIESGKIKPYTSNIVLMEIIFILNKLYKFSKAEVLAAISELLRIRNLTLIERTDTKTALAHFADFNTKYADCLLSTQIPTGTSLVTYDADFAKIPAIKLATLREMIG